MRNSKSIAEEIRKKAKKMAHGGMMENESHLEDDSEEDMEDLDSNYMSSDHRDDDFLSQDGEQEAFPEKEYDVESEASEIPSEENKAKKRVAMIMGARRMGKLSGRAGKEDKY
jgi:hypothetical protein